MIYSVETSPRSDTSRAGRRGLLDTTLVLKSADEFSHAIKLGPANQTGCLALSHNQTNRHQLAQVMRQCRRRNFKAFLKLPNRHAWCSRSHQNAEQAQACRVTKRFKARRYIFNLHACFVPAWSYRQFLVTASWIRRQLRADDQQVLRPPIRR